MHIKQIYIITKGNLVTLITSKLLNVINDSSNYGSSTTDTSGNINPVQIFNKRILTTLRS